MKKLYYFSSKKLQFVEIENYKKKLLIYFSIAVFIISGAFFGGYTVLDSVLNSNKSIADLRQENKLLRSKLKEYSSLFSKVNDQLDSITSINNYLRLAANLRPLSDDEERIGTGGGYFDNLLDFNSSSKEFLEMDNNIEVIRKKIEFEKAEYSLISQKFKENLQLFESIPAIKPCLGKFAADGFGMRRHPILKIKRIHEGIDVVTDNGTPVHSTGSGRVYFVGYKGGYGLTIEIDHGFGYRTVYAHLSKTLVREGQTLNRGHLIALSGNSGLSTGPHLHYEVLHNGINKDPENYFFDNTGFFEYTETKKM